MITAKEREREKEIQGSPKDFLTEGMDLSDYCFEYILRKQWGIKETMHFFFVFISYYLELQQRRGALTAKEVLTLLTNCVNIIKEKIKKKTKVEKKTKREKMSTDKEKELHEKYDKEREGLAHLCTDYIIEKKWGVIEIARFFVRFISFTLQLDDKSDSLADQKLRQMVRDFAKTLRETYEKEI